MGSLSLAEILVIIVVILVVFGPRRLPELSRRAGELLSKLREGTAFVTNAIDKDYGETIEPIRELKQELDGLRGDVGRAISSFTEPQPAPAEQDPVPPSVDDGETGENRPDATDR